MPQTLDQQIAPLVKALQEKRKVTFFLGAGISTSCGIPDFRSPKTGLYANLKRLNLPYPEAVFDIEYFRKDPKAFYTLCEELYPGKFFPSKFHFLLKLLHDDNLLTRVYTQNIDTMESIVGIHPDKIVAAHGSFATNHCIECAEPMETEDLIKLMSNKSLNDGIPQCRKCEGYVKPDIVFFGEALPVRFFDLWDEDCDNVEIAVVAGTSLTVYPFAGLPAECGRASLRVLVNYEVVGDFKTKQRKSDVVLKNDCDTVAETLAKQLGWEQRLLDLIAEEKIKFDAKLKSKDFASVANGEASSEEPSKKDGNLNAAEECEHLAQTLESGLEKLSI